MLQVASGRMTCDGPLGTTGNLASGNCTVWLVSAFFRSHTATRPWSSYCMDDKRAALLLATLALAGAATRLWLAPHSTAPGDVRLTVPAPPPGGLQATARQAVRLARPLAPGERIDVDAADVTELSRLPRV